ncbi:hypothetical protein Sango_2316200 [Sesamum angolense]|uniref:Integrase catalytic domain-containing protein n=1 Tax=Sesamum angolense TaxID=2727404 RepID=A0AAE2BLH8_9LAMI|nr:hypothetical protein Sango_2316200 [Sesamum angolense]
MPSSASLAAFNFPQAAIFVQLHRFYTNTDVGRAFVYKFRTHPKMQQFFSKRAGLLYHRNRLFIPPSSGLAAALLMEFHASPVGAHSGTKATLARLTGSFYWPGMLADVKKFVQECLVCQRNKYSPQAFYGLLQPLAVPDQIWEVIHGFHYTITVFYWKNHNMGCCRSFDQFWKEIFWLLGTTLAYGSSYHPQSDGQTEVLNSCLETYLRCFVSVEPTRWTQFLPLAEFWYNTSFHSAIGIPRLKPSMVENLPLWRVTHPATRSLSPWILLSPLAKQSCNCSRKLSPRYSGPFHILRRIGTVAYELELPPATRIHPIFHVSLLKPCYGSPCDKICPLLAAPPGLDPPATPAQILARRTVSSVLGPQHEVLVHWDGQDAFEATWELLDKFISDHSSSGLVDKALLDRWGNVREEQKQPRPKRNTKMPARFED